MSASNEKKTGQARSNITSWSNPRTAREAEKMKEERRSNILYATIGVVFLLVAISVFVWKSNVIQKHATAVTIHGENYTAAEVNYYFNSVYQNFVNSNYQYLSYLGLSTSTPCGISPTAVTGKPGLIISSIRRSARCPAWPR